MHYVHINNLLNHNQFGFPPKKCTTDAAITVKEFIEEGLRKGLTPCRPDGLLIKYPQFPDLLNPLNVQPHNIFLLTV